VDRAVELVHTADSLPVHLPSEDFNLSSPATHLLDAGDRVVAVRHDGGVGHHESRAHHRLARGMLAHQDVLGAGGWHLLEPSDQDLLHLCPSWCVAAAFLARIVLVADAPRGYSILTDLICSLLPVLVLINLKIALPVKVLLCGLMSLGLVYVAIEVSPCPARTDVVLERPGARLLEFRHWGQVELTCPVRPQLFSHMTRNANS